MKSRELSSLINELVFSPSGEAITRQEKLLLFVIANYYRDPPGYARPPETTIATNSRNSLRQVQRLVQRVEEKQLLRVERLRGGVNHYYFDQATLCAAAGRSAVDNPVYNPPDRVQNVTGDKMAPATKLCRGGAAKAVSGGYRQSCGVLKDLEKEEDAAADSLVRQESDLRQAVKKSRQQVLRSRELVARVCGRPVGRRWEPEDLWLKKFLESADCFFIPIGALDDPEWWDAVSKACGGVELEFLRPVFAKLRAWLLEHADRTPTTVEGWKELVRQWLCRENEYKKPKPVWRNRISCMSGAALMPMLIIAWFALQHMSCPWVTHFRYTPEEKIGIMIKYDERYVFKAKT
jgi:hypothetical protein